MKKIIAIFLFLKSIFVQANFLHHKIEQATPTLVDVLEFVHQDYIPCPQENVNKIDNYVNDLFDRAIKECGKSMRMYTFISINFSFDSVTNKDLSYLFYSLLYAEVDPAVLVTMKTEDINRLKKTVSSKLIGLYEDRKIGIENILSGCCVACVESGVEQIDTK